MKITLAQELIFLLSGITMGLIGLCITPPWLSLILVIWGVCFLIAAPVISVLKD